MLMNNVSWRSRLKCFNDKKQKNMVRWMLFCLVSNQHMLRRNHERLHCKYNLQSHKRHLTVLLQSAYGVSSCVWADTVIQEREKERNKIKPQSKACHQLQEKLSFNFCCFSSSFLRVSVRSASFLFKGRESLSALRQHMLFKCQSPPSSLSRSVISPLPVNTTPDVPPVPSCTGRKRKTQPLLSGGSTTVSDI